jgi:hypothetical protein
MDVRTELTSGGAFTFDVIAEGGSGHVTQRALRPILNGERNLFMRGEIAQWALTADNYTLTDVHVVAPGLARITIRPRRHHRMLIDGALLVTEDTADLLRIEGRLTRNPSFWTTRVDVIRTYGRVAGIRAPLRLEAVADVRGAGLSTMSMTYHYEMVNGIDVSTAIHSGGRAD